MSDSKSRLARGATLGMEIVAIVTLVIMMVHVVINAAMRGFANSPIEGTNEYAGYWYVPLIAFIGFVVARVKDEHIEVRLIFDRLPLQNQRELAILGDTLVVVCCAGFTWFGLIHALDNMRIGQTAGVTGTVIWPVSFMVPISFGLLGILTAVRAFEEIRGTRNPQDDHHDPVEHAAETGLESGL